MLKTATNEPATLAIAIDANAARLYDGFRRATRAKLDNALFAVANAEDLPTELDGRANEVRVHFPWGSLLDGILDASPAVVDGLASLLRPRDGTLTVLLSIVEKDRVAGITHLEDDNAHRITRRIAEQTGLIPTRCRLATTDDIAKAHSTWAKRLGVGRTRERNAWVLRFRRR